MKSRSDQIVADALAKHSNITRSNSGNLNEKVTLVPTVLHAFPARVGPALPARPLVNNVNSNGPFSDTSIMSDTTYSPRIPDRPHTSFENISDDPFTRVSTTRSQSTSAPFSYIQNQKTSSLILEKPHNYTIPASNQAPSLPSRSSIQQRFEKIEITDQNSKTKLPPPRPSKPAQLSTQSSTPISNEGNEIPSKKRPPPVPPSKSNPYNLDRYKQLFHQADSLKCGLLTALQVRSIWLKSGLGNKQLASIWKMVDIEPDHCLRIDKFCLGMYMIDQELGKLI